MVRFFSHRLTVRVIELMGIFCLATGIIHAYHDHPSGWLIALSLLQSLLYLTTRLFASVQWHPRKSFPQGIEVHFQRGLLLLAYTQFITGLLFLVIPHIILLLLCLLTSSIFLYVSIFLIRFHLKDGDPTPVNFFSHGTFLAEKAGKS